MVDAPHQNRFTVMLADEQETWHQQVRELLRPQGVQTVSVRTGREALSVMETRDVHVAILDAHMPQLGGLQVVKIMRDMPKAPPAILLTQHLTNHLLQEALGMRVFTVLSKPVDVNVLLDSLARVLRRHYSSRWPGEG